MDTTRPMTRHQCLFRLVGLSVCVWEGIEFSGRLVDKMRKHTMSELKSGDDRVEWRAIIYCPSTVSAAIGGLEIRNQLTGGG